MALTLTCHSSVLLPLADLLYIHGAVCGFDPCHTSPASLAMDGSSPPQLPQSVFHLSIGALEVGILVAVALFGTINVQASIYYKTRQANEPRFLKYLVRQPTRPLVL
jgi:hypothetical protein